MSTDNPDLNFLDPRFQAGPTGEPEEARVHRLRQRFGEDSGAWDKEFSRLDDSAEKARAATQQLRNEIASAGLDADRPLRFSVTIANRQVTIEVRERDGEWSCVMPCEIEIGVYEYRTLIAKSYDSLIGMVNQKLAAGPLIRDLSEAESLELSRACVTRKKERLAAVLEAYLRLRIGRDIESSLSDPRYRSVVDQACLFVFAHSEPEFPNTPEAIAYIKHFAAGRPLTVPICEAALAQYQKQQKADAAKPAPPHIGEADLEAATDQELRESWVGIAKARAEQDRKRRELVYGKQ